MSSPATPTHGQATDVRIAEVVAACKRYGGSSIIALAGVPGTGKSHIGRIAAQRVAGDPLRVREVQFHQSTTYEEFVEGLRIDASGAIVQEPGLFLEWNDLALDNPELKWVLLIEELSRANVSAVLGELMTFVEDRNRPFTATYSRRPIRVAPNLVLLATYNPSDRSALDIDNALLRRLRVINFPADSGQLADMLAAQLPANVMTRLSGLFSSIEQQHPDDFQDLMPFGHGIFAEVRQESPDLHELWRERIRHMLRRPLVQPHPFTDAIEAAYPWRDPEYAEP
ncbi:AAA family ATPase [Micromonospora fulviviridis]|uniref:AAA family ATPase n=1 Tax=Micromonospora fulviviridis TaxID=47860 RepID=UPI003787AADF